MDASNAKQENTEKITCIVKHITYRNPENNYSVIQVEDINTKLVFSVVGNCLFYPSGSTLVIEGIREFHKKFGTQIRALSATEIKPTTESGIVTYLSSGFFKGVGEKTAKKITKALGAEAMELILANPEEAHEKTKVNRGLIYEIHEALLQKEERVNVERYFSENGISKKLIEKILEHYPSNALSIINKDPYVLCYKIKGIGFLTADRIALQLGMEEHNQLRLRAGVFHVLEKAQESGHCYLKEEELIFATKELLHLNQEIDLISSINSLCKDEYAIREDDCIYLKKLYKSEKFLADFIYNLNQNKVNSILTKEEELSIILDVERELCIELSNEQKRAVELIVSSSFLVVTGGPGCGKTTVIRALTKVFEVAGLNYALSAPTGKAAQRMSEVSGKDAKTIHRLLKYNGFTKSFTFDEKNPIMDEATDKPLEALIIDESSMLDLQLAMSLFSALPKNIRLILVGDKDQLPSVGPGRVFGDLISIHQLPIISLSQLFRRKESSRITHIAHSINSGNVPEIPAPDGIIKSDAFFIERTDAESAAKLIESLYCQQIPEKFNINSNDITILTPMNKGYLGTHALNNRIQKRLLDNLNNTDILKFGEQEFRVGDKVCQRINNYNIDDQGVYNGDLGIVKSVDNNTGCIEVKFWDGRELIYERNMLFQLSLSYAMTIHRSQGSEMPCVVMSIHESHFNLLERQLLYTGVTRAKKLLIIVGSKRALEIACQKMSTKKRQTKLKERIAELMA